MKRDWGKQCLANIKNMNLSALSVSQSPGCFEQTSSACSSRSGSAAAAAISVPLAEAVDPHVRPVASPREELGRELTVRCIPAVRSFCLSPLTG